MNNKNIPGVLFVDAPETNESPLLLDSPHSGMDYPDDFNHNTEFMLLRRAEDTYVHELYGAAPSVGATLMGAHFPRSYIDVNRGLHEMDTEILDAPWPDPVEQSEKMELGIGLIWRKNQENKDIYNRKLSVAEAKARIDNYWQPYHDELRAQMDRLVSQYGMVWHLNCHSMPEMSNETSKEGPGVQRPEFCLGDRRGTTCDPEFTALTKDILEKLGYQCAVNEPYAGVELVRAYSNPANGIHSLQIETRRDLYMDEKTFEKNDRFEKTQADLKTLTAELADYARRKAS